MELEAPQGPGSESCDCCSGAEYNRDSQQAACRKSRDPDSEGNLQGTAQDEGYGGRMRDASHGDVSYQVS